MALEQSLAEINMTYAPATVSHAAKPPSGTPKLGACGGPTSSGLAVGGREDSRTVALASDLWIEGEALPPTSLFDCSSCDVDMEA